MISIGLKMVEFGVSKVVAKNVTIERENHGLDTLLDVRNIDWKSLYSL